VLLELKRKPFEVFQRSGAVENGLALLEKRPEARRQPGSGDVADG
jgi:hypothetical protein